MGQVCGEWWGGRAAASVQMRCVTRTSVARWTMSEVSLFVSSANRLLQCWKHNSHAPQGCPNNFNTEPTLHKILYKQFLGHVLRHNGWTNVKGKFTKILNVMGIWGFGDRQVVLQSSKAACFFNKHKHNTADNVLETKRTQK